MTTTKTTTSADAPTGAVTLVGEPAGVEIIEATGEGTDAPAPPRFSMVAYTGEAMRVDGWRHPVVVDLEGLSLPSQRRPIRFAHSAYQGVGHTDRIAVEDGRLVAEGVVSRDTPAAREVVASGKRGFPWQASIGAAVRRSEFVRAGQRVTVNGRVFDGPVYVARAATLGEISFVDLGADGNTSARIAANAQDDARTNGDTDNKESDVDGEQHTNNDAAANTNTNDDATPIAADAGAPAIEAELAAARSRAADELRRQDAIRRVCGDRHASIAAQAIEDGWSAERAELEVLRASRPSTPGVITGAGEKPRAGVLEAALCQAGGLDGLEASFDEKTLDAADRRFRGRLGLQDLIMLAAREGGHDASSFKADPRSALQAAFSTFSLPGILSNVANKFLLDGFNAVEDGWRRVTAIRSVSDFKRVTSYRLTGGFEYQEVGPDGELKHAEVGEESFGNQARTYGRMFSITRADLINDDLGALTAVPRRLGRGAALKLNDVFWSTFLNNASFFTAGNNNFISGADTAIGIDALTKAEQLFLDQTDPDGYPMAVSPAILLVPNALLVPASQLMNSTDVREDGNSSKSKYITSNPHAGKFSVVRSSYLANARYAGASTKAWYLLANPGDMPVIEVAFLNGRERPVVESADADFNTLGVQMRGYHDFGVELQDHRGGVKAKGEA